MDTEKAANAIALIVRDIIFESPDETTVALARDLVDTDADFILIMAGANPDNLREAALLASEALVRTFKTEFGRGNGNNNG